MWNFAVIAFLIAHNLHFFMLTIEACWGGSRSKKVFIVVHTVNYPEAQEQKCWFSLIISHHILTFLYATNRLIYFMFGRHCVIGAWHGGLHGIMGNAWKDCIRFLMELRLKGWACLYLIAVSNFVSITYHIFPDCLQTVTLSRIFYWRQQHYQRYNCWSLVFGVCRGLVYP